MIAVRSRALLLCLLLSACSGGGASLPAGPKPPRDAKTVKATVTVSVPAQTKSAARSPRYVSPSTQSMTVSVASQGGGGNASATVDCVRNGVTGGNTCSTTVDAPVGSDLFTVNLYDRHNGTGNLLSSGSATFTVVQGQLNLVSLTFGGIPAAIHLSATPAAFARGAADSAKLTVTEVDADNNIIVGPPDAYPSPITLQVADASGSVTLSPAQVTAASQPPVTVTYNGSASAPGSVTITATAPGIPAAKIDSLTIPIASGTFLYSAHDGDVDQMLVSNGVVQSRLRHFCGNGCTLLYNGTGTFFNSDTIEPDGTIFTTDQRAGGATAWSRNGTDLHMAPASLALAADGAGNIFASLATGISVYPPNPSDTTPPARVMNVPAGINGLIAVDPRGQMYTFGLFNQILAYAPNSAGVVAPARMITPQSGITFSGAALATDSADNLYVTGTLFSQQAVLVYAPNAQGAATPVRVISGASTTIIDGGLAVDTSGYIYTWSSTGIVTFAPNASGNVAPISTFAISPGRFAYLDSLVTDPNAVMSAGAPQGAPPATVAAFSIFPLPSHGTTTFPNDLAAGTDGNVWFTYAEINQVGKVTPSGTITPYAVPSGTLPNAITAGPDGRMWFTANGAPTIDAIDTSGVVTAYPLSPATGAAGITNGPDGNLWFTTGNNAGASAGKLTPAGVVTLYPLTGGGPAAEITTGPDGNLWALADPGIYKITPAGVVTYFASATPASHTQRRTIIDGPDGNVWFDSNTGIAKITPAGTVIPVITTGATCCAYREFTFGPDGNLFIDGIYKVTPSAVELWGAASPDNYDYGIIKGPDNNIWFLHLSAYAIGKLTLQ